MAGEDEEYNQYRKWKAQVAKEKETALYSSNTDAAEKAQGGYAKLRIATLRKDLDENNTKITTLSDRRREISALIERAEALGDKRLDKYTSDDRKFLKSMNTRRWAEQEALLPERISELDLRYIDLNDLEDYLTDHRGVNIMSMLDQFQAQLKRSEDRAKEVVKRGRKDDRQLKNLSNFVSFRVRTIIT